MIYFYCKNPSSQSINKALIDISKLLNLYYITIRFIFKNAILKEFVKNLTTLLKTVQN